MIKKLTFIAISLLLSLSAAAQEYSGGVKGTVVNRSDRTPVQGVKIALYDGTKLLAESESAQDGSFLIPNLANGMYTLVTTDEDYIQTSVNLTVNDGFVKNLFNISLTPARNISDMDDAVLNELDLDDTGYSDSPTYIFGSNDPFVSASSYNFGTVRYKTRGFDNGSQDVYLAGIKMNDAFTGFGAYSLWTGLNEATRGKDVTNGMDNSRYGFGGYNGLTNIYANAGSMRMGRRTSILTNSSLYRLRLMFSYGSGKLDNGWSYGFNISTRLGGNDWVRGVYYKSFSYFGSVEKTFSDVHRIGFTIMGAPGERGAQNGSTQEVYDLTGDNMYNSNWGFQDGKMRNARVRKTHEPIAILQYEYTPSSAFNLTATALYRFGKNGYTALDWYDSADPRPDYYRNLPSYFYSENADLDRADLQKWYWAKEAWETGYANVAHINWDRIYNVNSNNPNENGMNRSKYVQEERHVDQKDFNYAITMQWKPATSLTFNGGINGKVNVTENYKVIADLLGGDYYLDMDNFAERDYASSAAKVQNNLDYYRKCGTAPVLAVGDKYGYDYNAHMKKVEGWFNGSFVKGSFSATAAGRVGYETFWREGLVRKGLFAGLDENGNDIFVDGMSLTTLDSYGNVITSLGDSKHLQFFTYSAKGSLSYVFGGKLRLSANAGYFTEAPKFNKVFLSPRTRNSIVQDIDVTKTFSSDLNLHYSNKGYNLRLTGFYAKIDDQTDVMSFYDDSQSAFTNFAMSNIDERHVGIEFGFRIPTPVPSLTLEGAFALGEYVYTSTPFMTQTVDNSSETVIEHQQVPYWKSHPVFKRDDAGNITDEIDHFKRHYVPSTPQLASTIGLNYNYRNWYYTVDAQYFAHNYLDMNPLYRTDMATAGGDMTVTPTEVEYMAEQEEFEPCFLLNASIGKTKYIGQKQIGFSLSVRNILNNKDIRTGGYEQTRLIDNTKSSERFYRFDSRYFYLCGINYMLNIYFKF